MNDGTTIGTVAPAAVQAMVSALPHGLAAASWIHGLLGSALVGIGGLVGVALRHFLPELFEWIAAKVVKTVDASDDPSLIALAHAALHYVNVHAPKTLDDGKKALAVQFLMAHCYLDHDQASAVVELAWDDFQADLARMDSLTNAKPAPAQAPAGVGAAAAAPEPGIKAG